MAFTLLTQSETGDNWFAVTGIQLHSASPVKMTCTHRGDAGPTTFQFAGFDVHATADHVLSTDRPRVTTIGIGSIRIEQVEHVLSALLGMDCLDTTVSLEYLDGS